MKKIGLTSYYKNNDMIKSASIRSPESRNKDVYLRCKTSSPVIITNSCVDKTIDKFFKFNSKVYSNGKNSSILIKEDSLTNNQFESINTANQSKERISNPYHAYHNHLQRPNNRKYKTGQGNAIIINLKPRNDLCKSMNRYRNKNKDLKVKKQTIEDVLTSKLFA